MDRKSLIDQLIAYQTPYPEERQYIPLFLDLLTEEKCFLRSNLDRHITASAWIVSHDFEDTLLIHHKKLSKWLQPGGHADGNENVLEVALKEANEETGINTFHHVRPLIFDIDIHKIPEAKGIPTHFHYDIRFLFQAMDNTHVHANHESTAIAWIAFDQLDHFVDNNQSILRMAEKTKDQ